MLQGFVYFRLVFRIKQEQAVAFVGGQFGKPVILPQYVYNQFFFFHIADGVANAAIGKVADGHVHDFPVDLGHGRVFGSKFRYVGFLAHDTVGKVPHGALDNGKFGPGHIVGAVHLYRGFDSIVFHFLGQFLKGRNSGVPDKVPGVIQVRGNGHGMQPVLPGGAGPIGGAGGQAAAKVVFVYPEGL